MNVCTAGVEGPDSVDQERAEADVGVVAADSTAGLGYTHLLRQTI